MGRPRKILASRSVQIRLQILVEPGSIEESLVDYLNDEKARPLSKSQMFLTALLPFWQSLVVLYKQQPLELAFQTLENSRYLWNLHEEYLRRRLKREADFRGMSIPEFCLTSAKNHEDSDPPQSISLEDTSTSTEKPQSSTIEPKFNPFGNVISRLH